MRLVGPVLVVLSLAAAPAPAAAASIQDLLMLRAAGLGDDILVALIESDGSTFSLTPADIISLRQQGLSERVITAMLATRSATRTSVRVVERQADPVVRVVERTVEPVIKVEQRVEQRTTVVVVPAQPADPPKPVEPVYWGFGGQRRPDTWRDSTVAPRSGVR